MVFSDWRSVQVSVSAIPPIMNDAAVEVKVRHAAATIRSDEYADLRKVALRQFSPVARGQSGGEMKQF